MGIIQGGDPLSKDPAQAAKYGTGGLGVLRFEANAEKHTRGAVSAVLVPGRRDSAGSQFFISVSDQPALDGQYTVFARVAEGMTVAQKISTVAGRRHGADGARRDPARDDPRQAGAGARAVRRSATVEDMASQARGARDVARADHDRGLSRPRAEPRAAVPAAGGRPASTTARRSTAWSRASSSRAATCRRGSEPPDERQERYIRTLQPEFNDDAARARHRVDGARRRPGQRHELVLHRAGAHAGAGRALHGVRPRVAGLDVVEKIEAQPVDGETPRHAHRGDARRGRRAESDAERFSGRCDACGPP